jgi:hypothetical protein
MTRTTSARALPRLVIGTSLELARLPVAIAAGVAGRQGDDRWGPNMAFEQWQARIEGAFGAALRDEALRDRSRLRLDRVEQLRRSASLDAAAAAERAQAARGYEESRAAAERQRRAASRAAGQRKQAADRQAAQRQRRVAQRAAERAAAARETQQAHEEAIDQRARVARAESLAEEAAAIDATREALDAANTVEVIEETLHGSREARKTS